MHVAVVGGVRQPQREAERGETVAVDENETVHHFDYLSAVDSCCCYRCGRTGTCC